MSAEDWTEEKVAELRRLRCVEGKSAGQIAKQLGGFTRNAIIGKCIRLGLEPPEHLRKTRSASQIAFTNRKRFRSQKARLEVAAAISRPRPGAPMLKADPTRLRGAPKVGPQSVRFMHRYKYQCAMFCEGEEGALGFVCGKPTDGVSAWCDFCRELCYAKGAEKAIAA